MLDHLPAQTPLSLERDVFPAWVRARQLRGYIMDGYDMDIGTPEGFAIFEQFVQQHGRQHARQAGDALPKSDHR